MMMHISRFQGGSADECGGGGGAGMGGGVGKCVSSMKVEDQTSLNEIEFEFSGHLATLLAGLDRMRAKTQLTDVTLKTENRTFHVSRSKLSSAQHRASQFK